MALFANLKIGKVIWTLPNLQFGKLDIEIMGLDTVAEVCNFSKGIKNGFKPDLDDLPEIKIPKGEK